MTQQSPTDTRDGLARAMFNARYASTVARHADFWEQLAESGREHWRAAADGAVAYLAAQPNEAAEERDALLTALGWKTGPLRDELTRKVILEDSAGLRPEMVKARRAAQDMEADRDLYRWILGDEVHGTRSGLLARLWGALEAERRQRKKLEAAQADGEEQRAALTWFSGQTRLSLYHYSPVYGDDDEQSVEWRVDRESGSINDREWDTIARGDTAEDAILTAHSAALAQENRRG